MLFDNKNHGKVIQILRQEIDDDSDLSIISGVFSIYAFSAFKKELHSVATVRLLLSEWTDKTIACISGTQLEIPLKNALTQARIAKECKTWLETKASIRTNANIAVGNNLYHIAKETGDFAIRGTSPFTASGLGVVKSSSFDMNTGHSDSETTKEMVQYFDNIWHDLKHTKDIKSNLLEYLDYLSCEKSGSLIYFVTLYTIFKAYLEDITEDSIIRSKTGFKDTLVWNKLYKFQRDGVLGAIDKLEKYNGCIIADSVGLGKTFEALAVIKYYELRNDRVLVLCPKKLRENWTVYTMNDKLNLLLKDKFNYDVLNHTDLSRVHGKSGEINLETINWGNYDLVVIDESHNFRNNNTKSEGITRYQRLMDKIIKEGVNTKVLMLSATPVNNRMNDLKNQVAFITQGIETALAEYGIKSIENTLRLAQGKFNQWLDLPTQDRTSKSLLSSLSSDYFKLLDLLTIARSRKHIEKYYDVSEIGKFPERLKPLNIKTDIDSQLQFPPLKDVNILIKKLNLGVYAPLEYVRMDKKEEYSRKYDQQIKGSTSVFKQIDREKSLINLMRINLLKRMESSIHSFAQTIFNFKTKIEKILEQIETHTDTEFTELSIEDIEIDDPALEDYLIGNKKTKILFQDMDLIRWKQDLTEDLKALTQLHNDASQVTITQDAKLLELKTLIYNKITNPLNPDNKKIIIFTAFSDTAKYLYQNISGWVKNELGLDSALVTGSEYQSTVKDLNKNLNILLTYFSPKSKERDKISPDATDNIDILIATDCISEGQNLQDCDYLINYDIHWNPVRIIQRFGRIDRLGSKNDVIQLVNFWPNMELDEYINLEARVSGRMVLLDISATGEENVIENTEKKQMNDLEYRRRQMKQLQETIINLEDMDGSVSITDMTLNDFRMDLSEYLKENLQKLEQAPSGFFANVTQTSQEIQSGVIFCLKDIHVKVNIDSHYAFAPYYLVYVSNNGEVFLSYLQSKKILDILKKISGNHKTLDTQAIDIFNKNTKSQKNMEHYHRLLEVATESIIGKAFDKGIESLFTRGGTTLTQNSFSALDDFEVISYVIIQEAT